MTRLDVVFCACQENGDRLGGVILIGCGVAARQGCKPNYLELFLTVCP